MKKEISLGCLYFLLPLFFFLMISFSRENDIWFLFSHGRYLLAHGFPHIEMLTIHQDFHFVMQQWLSSFIFYSIYKGLGSVGIILLVGIVNIGILFVLYLLCKKISGNTYFSCLLASMIDLLLELNFIVPRPQIFSILCFLLVIYCLERKDKSVFFLPVISLFLINFHASMWGMLFILCLPYCAEYLLKREKSIYYLLANMILSFLVGFINPYGIEAMTYVIHSYGSSIINSIVGEMHSFSLVGDSFVTYNSTLLLLLVCSLAFCFWKKREKVSIHMICLFLGLSLMAFLNLRNQSLFLIGAVPFLSIIFSREGKGTIPPKMILVLLFVLVGVFSYRAFTSQYEFRAKRLEKIVDYLEKYVPKDSILYNEFDDGAYLEYHGFRGYIDSRAEIFLKGNNQKYDVLDEYYHVLKGDIVFEKFIEKYHFQYFLVYKDSPIFHYLNGNSEIKEIFHHQDIIVFQNNMVYLK